PNTVVAVLHLEHPRTVLQNIGIDVHLNETATLSDIVLAIHGLKNRSVLRLQERERVGDRVIRLDHTNSVAAPSLYLLSVRLVRLSDTVLRDEPGRQIRGSQGSAESVERILVLIDQFSIHVDATRHLVVHTNEHIRGAGHGDLPLQSAPTHKGGYVVMSADLDIRPECFPY